MGRPKVSYLHTRLRVRQWYHNRNQRKFDPDDRRKHLEIKRQHPELDIRFVFSNAKAKINKGAKQRNFEWCEKNGFQWSHRVIPEEWLKEKGSCTKLDRIVLKTERRT